MANKIYKFINYHLEAFKLPLNLFLLSIGIIGAGTVAALGNAWTELNMSFVWLMLGGLEMTYLGLMSRNKRFIKAINAKKFGEIQDYNHIKEVSEYFKDMSQEYQKKFMLLKSKVNLINEHYRATKNDTFGSAFTTDYIEKLRKLELAYIRLLYKLDKLSLHNKTNTIQSLKKEYMALDNEIKNLSGKVKAVKIQRKNVIIKRLKKFRSVTENREVYHVQLKTIEDMVDYIREYAVTLKDTTEINELINSVLHETELTEQNIEEIESILGESMMPNAFEEEQIEFELTEEEKQAIFEEKSIHTIETEGDEAPDDDFLPPNNIRN